MRIFIIAIGWIGAFLLQFKYYLQVYTIKKTKNSKGLSMNYLFLNLVAYFLLSICYSCKYFYQNNGVRMTELSDIFLVIHGTFIVLYLIILSYKTDLKSNPFTISGKVSSMTLFFGSLIYFFLKKFYYTNQITTLELLGFQMFIANIFKYVSQIKFMKQNNSVEGLNSFYLFLDFSGCSLNLFQYFLDYYVYVYNRNFNHHPFVMNYVKLTLLLSSIITNLIALFIQKLIKNKVCIKKQIIDRKIELN